MLILILKLMIISFLKEQLTIKNPLLLENIDSNISL